MHYFKAMNVILSRVWLIFFFCLHLELGFDRVYSLKPGGRYVASKLKKMSSSETMFIICYTIFSLIHACRIFSSTTNLVLRRWYRNRRNLFTWFLSVLVWQPFSYVVVWNVRLVAVYHVKLIIIKGSGCKRQTDFSNRPRKHFISVLIQ